MAATFARIALENIAREYPNHPQYLLESDTGLVAPRIAHPSFFGCFDWHSAVHTHWMLVRLLRANAQASLMDAIVPALTASLAPERTSVEARYLAEHRTFERPYGIAWLAHLDAEVAASPHAAARSWSAALRPLAAQARANALHWLDLLRYPVRSGTHNQTAFALTLLFDAADASRDMQLLAAVRACALKLYRADVDAPLRYEPSGEDFLSPALMEADLMRRVLGTTDFAAWLDRFLPGLAAHDSPGWLDCAQVADDTDGKIVHLHGLNLSRAWNLAHIAAALPPDDPRRAALSAAAERHRAVGVAAALGAMDYVASHWLPTFVVYLLTGSGD